MRATPTGGRLYLFIVQYVEDGGCKCTEIGCKSTTIPQGGCGLKSVCVGQHTTKRDKVGVYVRKIRCDSMFYNIFYIKHLFIK